MKILSQDSLSPGRDLNPGSPEYEAGVLTTFFISPSPPFSVYLFFCFSNSSDYVQDNTT
jgi:hypothetical protein